LNQKLKSYLTKDNISKCIHFLLKLSEICLYLTIAFLLMAGVFIIAQPMTKLETNYPELTDLLYLIVVLGGVGALIYVLFPVTCILVLTFAFYRYHKQTTWPHLKRAALLLLTGIVLFACFVACILITSSVPAISFSGHC
jgi:hypothetical protein